MKMFKKNNKGGGGGNTFNTVDTTFNKFEKSLF